jgi:hypothetical protein
MCCCRRALAAAYMVVRGASQVVASSWRIDWALAPAIIACGDVGGGVTRVAVGGRIARMGLIDFNQRVCWQVRSASRRRRLVVEKRARSQPLAGLLCHTSMRTKGSCHSHHPPSIEAADARKKARCQVGRPKNPGCVTWTAAFAFSRCGRSIRIIRRRRRRRHIAKCPS